MKKNEKEEMLQEINFIFIFSTFIYSSSLSSSSFLFSCNYQLRKIKEYEKKNLDNLWIWFLFLNFYFPVFLKELFLSGISQVSQRFFVHCIALIYWTSRRLLLWHYLLLLLWTEILLIHPTYISLSTAGFYFSFHFIFHSLRHS